MGIIQSVIRFLGDIADDEKLNERQRPQQNSYNNYNNNSCREKSHHQWQNGNYYSSTSTQSNLRSYSYPNTSVNDKKVKVSCVSIKEITSPQNASRRPATTIGVGPEKVEAKERKERPVVINSTPAPVGRSIKHYSSSHRILLVGEGDFSFSTCLATAFVWASNMIATSLDSQDFLIKNYESAASNILGLSTRKCLVMHEIDATKMVNHHFLGGIKFDRIIFNFPFAGFFKQLSRECVLRRHRSLVSLFLKNAKEMLSENGEIHISHKTNGFHVEWKLESLASSHRLRLIEAVDFNHLDYPGYNTKRGFGGDNNFDCYPSKTYKFGL
ncbi:hypothetical protein BUALT_Bualt03G0101500 [Buddleja alternifolia]|uniref:25S rRNA (uridine-N(3))-methyltransferase BMT5-like domain-containing protein n=1 Tax=Buddleja alternifolia TaxID=168488 RepID=A0AAV6Y3T4_9LAMI|nr:hypothetical protein BUALT_Bualt03G0101500 [Buddleja alternifolia]